MQFIIPKILPKTLFSEDLKYENKLATYMSHIFHMMTRGTPKHNIWIDFSVEYNIVLIPVWRVMQSDSQISFSISSLDKSVLMMVMLFEISIII